MIDDIENAENNPVRKKINEICECIRIIADAVDEIENRQKRLETPYKAPVLKMDDIPGQEFEERPLTLASGHGGQWEIHPKLKGYYRDPGGITRKAEEVPEHILQQIISEEGENAPLPLNNAISNEEENHE